MSATLISVRRALGDDKFLLWRESPGPNPRGERKWEGVRRTAAAQDKGRDRDRGGEGETYAQVKAIAYVC